MSKGSSSSQREATDQEKALWESQAVNLDAMTKIAEEQYDLSVEDREYYEQVFREGTDTEAKQAIAKLQSTITGEEVSATDIDSVDIDSLLRDTLLTASPEFRESASAYIQGNEELTSQYGADVTGLSEAFSTSIQGFTDKYSQDIAELSSQTGTINQDVLSRETGSAQAGISTAFEEARQQMSGDLARRGLAGSGIEANALADTYQSEAMAKATAGTQARATALQQSEAIRQTQAGYAGSQLQAETSGASTAYNAQLGGIQNVYGVQSQSNLSNYQIDQSAQLQGIAGLTQVAQAGQGIYTGSQNYLSGAGATAGQASSIAGSSATGVANADANYAQAQAQANASSSAGIGSLIGTLGSAGIGAGWFGSDFRFKNNIKLQSIENGIKLYTWEWNKLAYEYLGKDNLYFPFGVIAQELMITHPDLVIEDENGYYSVNYSGLQKIVVGE